MSTPTHTPSHMPASNRPLNAGSSLDDDASRLDGVAKVTGKAKYSRDQFLPGSLFAAFVRCPYGAGALESFDEPAAKGVPGAVEVTISGKEGQYHGHPVGHVVAESPMALRRMLRALSPKWKPGSVKTRLEDDLPAVPEPGEDTRALLAKGAFVLEASYATQVQTHVCLETHGCVVDHRGDSATVYSSTQGTFAARDGVEDSIGLEASKFEVVCEYVGGGFGSKLNGAGKEGALAARLGKKYSRPVYVFLSREEDHLDAGNRPSGLARVKLAVAQDGTVLGGQVALCGGTGVSRGGGGMSFPSGRYDLGEIQRSHKDVQFNAGSPRPFRAPAAPQGAFVEELVLDEIALLASVDPIELRKKLCKSDDHKEMLDQGAKLIGWEARKPTGSQSGSVRRGFGAALCAWHGGRAGAEAEVILHRDGSVEARSGAQDIGTGTKTIVGVGAASVLGIPLRHVEARVGRSSLPDGPNSGGSITAASIMPAVFAAAEDAKGKLLENVAQRLGGSAGDYSIADGSIVKDAKPVLSWSEACAAMGKDSITGRSDNQSAAAKRHYGQGHSQGAQFVDLEVDTELGLVRVRRVVAIQACGQVVSRKTAESQIIGGVIQGLSYALFEDRVLDRQLGAMLNANMEWYKVLGPADMPHIEPVFYRKGQTGVRAVGEPPTVPTAGAVACAVFNALGAPVRSIPITPAKVLEVLASQGGKR